MVIYAVSRQTFSRRSAVGRPVVCHARGRTDVPLLRGGYGRARRPNHLLYCSVSLFSILAGGGGGTQQGVAPPPPPGRHGRQGGGWCGTGGTGGVAVVVAQPFRRPAAPTGSSFFAPLTLPPIDLLRCRSIRAACSSSTSSSTKLLWHQS